MFFHQIHDFVETIMWEFRRGSLDQNVQLARFVAQRKGPIKASIILAALGDNERGCRILNLDVELSISMNIARNF